MDGDDDEDDDNDEDDGDLVLQLFTLPPYNKNLQSAYLGPLRLVHRNPCVPDSLHALPRDDGDVHGSNVPDRPLHAAGRRIRLRQENSDEPVRDDLIVLP